MKIFYVMAACFALLGCSRGSGTYVGQVVDVGWEGFFVKTCEAEFKTSEQASTAQSSSSYSQELCNKLQSNVGKKYRVKWRHCSFCFALDSNYEITALEEI